MGRCRVAGDLSVGQHGTAVLSLVTKRADQLYHHVETVHGPGRGERGHHQMETRHHNRRLADRRVGPRKNEIFNRVHGHQRVCGYRAGRVRRHLQAVHPGRAEQNTEALRRGGQRGRVLRQDTVVRRRRQPGQVEGLVESGGRATEPEEPVRRPPGLGNPGTDGVVVVAHPEMGTEQPTDLAATTPRSRAAQLLAVGQ